MTRYGVWWHTCIYSKAKEVGRKGMHTERRNSKKGSYMAYIYTVKWQVYHRKAQSRK